MLTATDTAAQQFETVFPEFFIKAFDDPAADSTTTTGSRSGRRSPTRAAECGSGSSRRGSCATERPLLDDTGDGVGREALSPGPDGALARVT